MTAFYDDWLEEVLVEVVDEFDDSIGVMTGYSNGIPHSQLRDHFTKSNSTSMRTYWNAKLGSHKYVGNIFIDTRNSSGIYLHYR